MREARPKFSLENLLTRIFITKGEVRLRAGWRMLVHVWLYLILTVGLIFPFAFAAPLRLDDPLLLFALTGLPMALSVLAARRWIDRRSIASLGLRLEKQAVMDVLAGVGISAAQFSLIFAIQVGAGWLDFTGFAWQQQPLGEALGKLVGSTLLFLAVGFYEEFFSRGYQLQNLEEGLNTPLAALLSSLIFGLLHLSNPNSGWVAAAGIFLAGLFLALGYLRTRQLWLPIGLHLGWNLFEGPVFGFPVSGMDTARLLIHRVSGPELFTGGAFGPEAGLVLLPAIVLGAGLVWLYTRKRILPKR